MRLGELRVKYKYRHPNQKPKLYRYKIKHQPTPHYRTIKINTKSTKNYKQTKYQLTKEEEPTKYKTTNKYQPEPAQVDILSPKPKRK